MDRKSECCLTHRHLIVMDRKSECCSTNRHLIVPKRHTSSVSVLKGIFDFHRQVEKVFIRKDLHIIFTPGKLPNYKDLNLWGGQKVEIQGKLIGKKKSSKCPTSQARIALVYLTLWLTMNVVCLWADLIHLFSMLGYNPQ